MANTFELIASSTVTGATAANITLSSIPSTYTDLCLKLMIRCDAGGGQAILMDLNNSSSNFTVRLIEGSGSAVSSGSTTVPLVGTSTGTSNTSNTFTNVEVYIPNYAGSNNKSYSSDSAMETNATTAYLNLIAGLWSNSAAISSIKIYTSSGSNLVQNSTAYLYGVKNA
jgi:hypothetical protein